MECLQVEASSDTGPVEVTDGKMSKAHAQTSAQVSMFKLLGVTKALLMFNLCTQVFSPPSPLEVTGRTTDKTTRAKVSTNHPHSPFEWNTHMQVDDASSPGPVEATDETKIEAFNAHKDTKVQVRDI